MLGVIGRQSPSGHDETLFHIWHEPLAPRSRAGALSGHTIFSIVSTFPARQSLVVILALVPSLSRAWPWLCLIL
jgi:hypothetical protein